MRFSLLAVMVLSLCVLADTASERIMADENLTVDQTALYLVYSVVAPERLPAEYTLNVDPVRSGSPALHEAFLLEKDVSEATLREMVDLVSRPTLSGTEITFNSPAGYFKMHYTTTGADAVTQSYAEEMAGYFDTAWEHECNVMNYFCPPPDNGVGGDDLYDVYIIALSGGTLGYTSCGGEYKPPDSTHDCSASHIAMNTNLGYNWLTTTSTHEFQHAIQNSYDYNEPTWFLENCAVWMEDQVWPDVDDWTGFWGESSVRKPYLDMASGNPHWYGNCIWPWMMGNMFGVDAVREVWQNCADTPGANMWEAQDEMFQAHGMDLESGIMAYGLWRYFTGPLWNENYDLYDENLDIPMSGPVVFAYHNHTELPASGNQMTKPLETTGTAWIRVDLTDYQGGWVEMQFDGRDYFDFNLGAFIFNENEYLFNWYDCDPTSGDVTVAVPTSGYDYAVFFPVFMTETSLAGNFEYSITYSTGVEGGETLEGNSLSLHSNPMAAGSAVDFTVSSTAHADLALMDLTGRRVATLFSGPAQQGLNTVEFQGGLPAGTYMMVLRSGNSIEAQRVSILR